jgi:hypothetical protein
VPTFNEQEMGVMAEEAGKKAQRQDAGKKAQRKEKRGQARQQKAAGTGGEKKKNPVVEEARTRYTEQLRQQGVPQDQVKQKMKTHMKDVVKPAMSEAKTGAKSKNLKGPERKKFVQDAVRAKLGLQA